MSDSKLEQLESLIRSYQSCLVAYSGGVDSAFLAVLTHRVLGDKALAAIADSPSLPRSELAEARALARAFGFRLRAIQTQELTQSDYTSNPVNRCYFCRAELFRHLTPIALEERIDVVVYGENASDLGDLRPGRVAAHEFQVRAPLAEVGLEKSEIRALSRAMGLPTADKAAQPCLSSRIPYGEVVNPEKLALIEQGEGVLHERGFDEVRVRLHERAEGYGARIEIPEKELSRFIQEGHQSGVEQALEAIGFQEVLVDPRGYRRGSLNEAQLPAPSLSESPSSIPERERPSESGDPI